STPSSQRLQYRDASPAAMSAMLALETAVRKAGLDPILLDLVKLRASQINGCAYCIDLHAREAKQKGENDRRLHLLPAWREVPSFFSPRERAALAWTESLTLISENHVPDDVYAQASQEFSETELTNLTLAVVAINGWNRFSISFRAMPDPLEKQA
ncbi:MAG: carboxymuconolactone decarboxylase family protein, partial [Roseimicrobium sp.]